MARTKHSPLLAPGAYQDVRGEVMGSDVVITLNAKHPHLSYKLVLPFLWNGTSRAYTMASADRPTFRLEEADGSPVDGKIGMLRIGEWCAWADENVL